MRGEYNNLVKIFSGSSNEDLAKKIAQKLDTALSPHELFIFPDKERRIQLQEVVLGEDVIIVQSTSTPADTYYMELFFLIDAAKRSGAKTVSVVMPYVGYQRQDHIFRDGEAVSLDVCIRIIESMGVDRIYAVDLHSIKIPELFKIPIHHLSALPLFSEKMKEEHVVDSQTILVSPDMGGIRRIEIMSGLLDNMPYVNVIKNRDLATGTLEVSSFDPETSFEHKTAITKRVLIVDDMISSGGTIIKSAELLHHHGAEEIYVFVTHPIFSDEAPELLQKSLVKKVYVTDSVFVPEKKRFEKLEILSLGTMIARAITENT